jgi:hypothetical protein
MELTKQFGEEQYAAALESWSWLDLQGKTPRFASLFGNVFLEDADGAWWFAVDRIQVFPFSVVLNIAGRLHGQFLAPPAG